MTQSHAQHFPTVRTPPPLGRNASARKVHSNTALTPSPKQSKKPETGVPETVYIIVHGETLNDVFSGRGIDWIKQVSTQESQRAGFMDLNLPKVPKRSSGFEEYRKDPPLTEIAKLEAKLLGRAFLALGHHPPSYIWSSPAYCCLAMASGFAKGICSAEEMAEAKIKIEPGLLQGGFAYGDEMVSFIDKRILQAGRILIDSSYSPVYQASAIPVNESLDKFYARSSHIVRKIVAMSKKEIERKQPILIFSHNSCLETLSRGLLGAAPQSTEGHNRALQLIGPTSILRIIKNGDGHWTIAETPPELTVCHKENDTFNWNMYSPTNG